MALFVAGQKLRASQLNDVLAPESGAEGSYSAASAQTINNATDTLVAFGTTDTASSYITKTVSGVGHNFELTEAGVWAITCNIRFFGDAGGGERYAAIRKNGSVIASQGSTASTNTWTACLSYTGRFASGDDITILVYQNSAGTLDLDAVPAARWNALDIVYVRP